ncbi:ParA family protein [Kribbella sp. NPDC020789]
MAIVLAIGSPKGGVGKTVSSVTLATMAAKLLKLHVFLVDTDENRCALDWVSDASDDDIPIDASYGADDPDTVAQLREADYDLAVLDLAGDRTGYFAQLLKRQRSGEPAVDFLLIPSKAELIDIRPVARVIADEVQPLDLPYLMVLTQVKTAGMTRAERRRDELRENGFTVADRIVREYSTHNEASEVHKTVLDLPGKHSKARSAEEDYRALGVEVFGAMGFDIEPLKERSKWLA